MLIISVCGLPGGGGRYGINLTLAWKLKGKSGNSSSFFPPLPLKKRCSAETDNRIVARIASARKITCFEIFNF